ncbi:MAG: arsenite methyltransferase [Acidimicrobiales bacterium]
MTTPPETPLDAHAANEVQQLVKQRYGAAARQVAAGCCGGAGAGCDPVSGNLYDDGDAAALPVEALQASLGCGNPTALASLAPGEIVLDLGSGGGVDVLLAARRVGPTGKAFGLDMTDEMLALAEENRRKAGLTNVEFLRGEIESIPLPDESVDVVISNCVINLSFDKDRVLRESWRVLRSGGRFAISDLVVRGAIPDALRTDADAWAGCLAGALEETEYREKLAAAGFSDVEIVPTRVYSRDDVHAFLSTTGQDADRYADDLAGRVMSAFVRAVKRG